MRDIDLQAALLDPASVFRDPEEVVAEDVLTRQQKIAILQRWEYDARELEVATEENMQPTDGGDLLGRILDAFRQLGHLRDSEHSAPTKQGGVRGSPVVDR